MNNEKCPNCGREIDDNVIYCAYCGTKIKRIEKCKMCDKEIALGDEYCKACKEKITNEHNYNKEEKENKILDIYKTVCRYFKEIYKTRKFYCMCAAFVIFLLCFIVIVGSSTCKSCSYSSANPKNAIIGTWINAYDDTMTFTKNGKKINVNFGVELVQDYSINKNNVLKISGETYFGGVINMTLEYSDRGKTSKGYWYIEDDKLYMSGSVSYRDN